MTHSVLLLWRPTSGQVMQGVMWHQTVRADFHIRLTKAWNSAWGYVAKFAADSLSDLHNWRQLRHSEVTHWYESVITHPERIWFISWSYLSYFSYLENIWGFSYRRCRDLSFYSFIQVSIQNVISSVPLILQAFLYHPIRPKLIMQTPTLNYLICATIRHSC